MVWLAGQVPAAATQAPEGTWQAWPGLADPQGYFPLEAGNEWVYSDGRASFTVRVTGSFRESGSRTYFEVSGYFGAEDSGPRRLRRDIFGHVLEHNPGGEDFLWYRHNPFIRGPWVMESGRPVACIHGSRAMIGNAGETVSVEAGVFDRALRVDFTGICADAGFASEYFAPGVGLIRRVTVTIAGPRQWNLVSARVGGKVWPQARVGVDVAVDRPVYFNNFMPPVSDPVPTMHARLEVRNETDTPLELEFSTSQRFDFVVRDASGAEVLRWSDGMFFLMILGRERLAGGKLTYSASLRLVGKNGRILPAGFYTMQGILTTANAGEAPLQGSVRFEIRDVF